MTTTFQRATTALALSLAATTAASAQTPPSTANPKITTRQLGAVVATSPELLGSLAALRQLPNGNVLVNDQARHRVLLLDKDLKLVNMVADSTSNTGNAYGVQPGGLIPFRGDSTLFIDPASLSMLVIDPNGKLTRTMAAPRPNDIRFLTGGALGNPGFDAKGRLIYRTLDFGFGRGGRGGPPQPGQPFVMPQQPDTAALVRFDLTTRKLDTAGFFKLAKQYINMSMDDNGRMNVSVQVNPLPVVDDWAIMSDGSIAFVRGRDYHIDFVDPSGTVTKAEKIAYDWQRMNEDDKQAFLDSAKVVLEKARAGGPQAMAAAAGAGGDALGGGGAAQAFGFGGGGRGGDGGGLRIQIGGDGGGRGAPPAGGQGRGPDNGPNVGVNMVPTSELPDYKPVFAQGAVRADMDNRLWVRTIATKVTTGGAIYEVIDRTGKLIDRVQIPAGRAIAGFGTGGVVYLGYRDADGIHMQKAVFK